MIYFGQVLLPKLYIKYIHVLICQNTNRFDHSMFYFCVFKCPHRSHHILHQPTFWSSWANQKNKNKTKNKTEKKITYAFKEQSKTIWVFSKQYIHVFWKIGRFDKYDIKCVICITARKIYPRWSIFIDI